MSLQPVTTCSVRPIEVNLQRGNEQSYFHQLKGQIVSLIYWGKLGAGDRLPSARRLADQLGVNPKTVGRIYRRLRDEGYLEIKRRSGARVKGQVKMAPGGGARVSQLAFVRKTLHDAERLGLSPDRLADLIRRQARPSSRHDRSVLVVECNREQVLCFARQIEQVLGITAHPVLLEELAQPGNSLLRKIAAARCFVTTHFHWNEVSQRASAYGRSVVEIRLDPKFFESVLRRSRRGAIGVIATDATFTSGFRTALRQQSRTPFTVKCAHVDDREAVTDVLAHANPVFVSPLYPDRIAAWRKRTQAEIVPLGYMIARESLDMMEASIVTA